MQIRVKSKYKDSTVRLPFGKSLKPVALKDLTDSECKKYFNAGFTEYFEDIDAKSSGTSSTRKVKKNDDKNNKRGNSSRLSDIDRESDSK